METNLEGFHFNITHLSLFGAPHFCCYAILMDPTVKEKNRMKNDELSQISGFEDILQIL